jgi:protein SCO1
MKQPIRKPQPSVGFAGLLALSILTGTLFSTGCAATSSPRRLAAGSADCCTKEMSAAAPVSDRSIYQLDSSWTNDQSAALKLVSLRGRPQIVTMFFAKCEFACPILIHDMKRIEAALPENMRTNVGFVLVSFDSERDTPAALAAYRKIHELPPNWTLLRGSPDDVLEFATLLGVKYRKDLRGQFAHSNLITVLDPGGELVHQQAGLNQSPRDTVQHILKVLRP